jgi:hypothetical protein
MTEILLILGIYIIGVLVAICIAAYINAQSDSRGIPASMCALSWVFIFVIILMSIAYPFALLYDKLYDKFLEHKEE